MLIIFTSDGKKRDILYLVAALPRPRCPDLLAAYRARGADSYLACPMLALPACVPLAFLESKASKESLREAAASLSGGLEATRLVIRGTSAYAETAPHGRWLQARGIFSGICLESPYTELPGICLGPSPAEGRPPLSGTIPLRSLSVDLIRIGFPEGRWETGLEWAVIASIRAPKGGR